MKKKYVSPLFTELEIENVLYSSDDAEIDYDTQGGGSSWGKGEDFGGESDEFEF